MHSNSQGASLNPNGASNASQPSGGEFSPPSLYTRMLAAVTVPGDWT